MYLVHSYYAEKNQNTIATTDYSESYSTALQKDNFFGVQFHPEKSGVFGSKILENFLKLWLIWTTKDTKGKIKIKAFQKKTKFQINLFWTFEQLKNIKIFCAFCG